MKVGIVRDEKYLEHKTGHIHPEHPNRLKAVYRMLDTDFSEGLICIKPEPASLEHLEFVHTPAYIEKVLKTADHNFTSLAPDTPASAMTYLAAWLAVGGCIKGLESLVSGRCDVCFSLVRPPGHHALADRAGGFCIFNNLGIVARYAMRLYGFERILIIDWDIHHGNGLQEMFYEEKEVLYLSSHDTLLYPYTGNWEENGKGRGKGFTINIPIPRELEDREMLRLYRETAVPVARQYCPELILVSAGFDAHHQDPIGRSRLTEEVFRWLTALLLDLRAEINCPVLLSLEGGYYPRALTSCIKEVLNVLTGKNSLENIPDEKTALAEKLIEKTRRFHARYGVWTD
ncbi:MAG: histone deacetylase [Desulfobacterales bacterium]|nr:histone deacetylase [Desulfobacterales bacterium]